MSTRFDILPVSLEGVVALKRKRMGDERGWLERLFCAEELRGAGWKW